MTAPTVSADRLSEIKARAEAATPGPWSAADERELWREEDPSIEPSWCVSHMRPGFEAMGPTEGYLGDVFTTAGCFESTEADARFVAAAREDVPWLVEQVEGLERWKSEAIEVMTSLPELGKALGLPLGVQITGPAALAEVARLTAERDAFRKREEYLANEVEWWKERFPCDGLCSDASEEDCSRHGRSPADLWRIISEVAAERDALAQEAEVLRAKVAAVEALVDSNPDHADTCGSVLTPGADYPCSCWQTDLRAALATTGEDQ